MIDVQGTTWGTHIILDVLDYARFFYGIGIVQHLMCMVPTVAYRMYIVYACTEYMWRSWVMNIASQYYMLLILTYVMHFIDAICMYIGCVLDEGHRTMLWMCTQHALDM